MTFSNITPEVAKFLYDAFNIRDDYLKGNCTARKTYDCSLQNDRAQKVMNF